MWVFIAFFVIILVVFLGRLLRKPLNLERLQGFKRQIEQRIAQYEAAGNHEAVAQQRALLDKLTAMIAEREGKAHGPAGRSSPEHPKERIKERPMERPKEHIKERPKKTVAQPARPTARQMATPSKPASPQKAPTNWHDKYLSVEDAPSYEQAESVERGWQEQATDLSDIEALASRLETQRFSEVVADYLKQRQAQVPPQEGGRQSARSAKQSSSISGTPALESYQAKSHGKSDQQADLAFMKHLRHDLRSKSNLRKAVILGEILRRPNR